MGDVYKTDDSWMQGIDFSNQKETIKALDSRDALGFNGKLNVRFLEQSPDRAVVALDITEDLFQPFGFMHGGVTLALIESAASRAVDLRCDFSKERPFGISISVEHKKPGKSGVLRAVAELSREEKNKQFWNVKALDDVDDIISEGTFVTKIVSLERLAQKDRERN